MACPQCGGTLLTYSLGRREASVCEDCGYVGIAADHKGDPVVVESWNDALRRFYAEHGADADPYIEVARDDVAEKRREGESWDEALERFYADHEASESNDADGADEEGDDEQSDDDQSSDEQSNDERPDESSDEEREKSDVLADDESAADESSEAPASQSSADGS